MKKPTDKQRLEDLERRVRELEARPPVTVQPIYIPGPPTYYPWWGVYPWQPYTQPYTLPVITYGGQSPTIVGNATYTLSAGSLQQ